MPERSCTTCGCTDSTPCFAGGHACSWSGPELCSACDPSTTHLVVDALVLGVDFLQDGKTATRMRGRLADGRLFEMSWPGTHSMTTTKDYAHDPAEHP